MRRHPRQPDLLANLGRRRLGGRVCGRARPPAGLRADSPRGHGRCEGALPGIRKRISVHNDATERIPSTTHPSASSTSARRRTGCLSFRTHWTTGLGVGCAVPSCLGGTHHGLWLVPLNSYYMTTTSAGDGSRAIVSNCSMPDTCTPVPNTEAEMLDFLRSNFERYYHSNRAPFPVFIHETWLWTPGRRQGYLSFVDWLLTLDDVFIISVAEVVRFMKDPKPIGEYVQVDCSKASEFKRCPEVHTCSFPDSPIKEARYLVGCRPCPQRYPWLRNVVQTVKHDVSYEIA
ncbi:hypothetical protein MRX96_012804 [Rhipicephalus microplus]